MSSLIRGRPVFRRDLVGLGPKNRTAPRREPIKKVVFLIIGDSAAAARDCLAIGLILSCSGTNAKAFRGCRLTKPIPDPWPGSGQKQGGIEVVGAPVNCVGVNCR